MAAEKKKAEKKAAEKKTTKKVATAKTAVKKGKKKLTTSDLSLSVPKGGQIIKHFDLMPALPSEGAPGDWKFTERGSSTDISSLIVSFQENLSPLERELERAVLVVKIKQNPVTVNEGTWRFALGGVATDHADEDRSNDISVDVIDNGFTLLVYVQVLSAINQEQIPFGFVASFTYQNTGIVAIYESQDPEIKPKRP